MKKNEFLAQLGKALENELDTQKVKEYVEYYEEYIQGEMKQGLSETEVIDQLGDPWAIAKTILFSEKLGRQEYSSETQENSGNDLKGQGQEAGNWPATIPQWKVYVVIAVIVLLLLLLLAFVFGVIAFVVQFVIRFALPILVIILVWKIFTKK